MNQTMNRPDGWIYEKESILEYILHKKTENARLLKEYERQKNDRNKELKELAEIEQKEKLEKFLKSEGKLVSSALKETSLASSSSTSEKATRGGATAAVKSVSNMQNSKLPSFWIPSLSPRSDAKPLLKKPVGLLFFFFFFFCLIL
jgi:nitric oxide synthase-interacting protein